MKTHHFVMLLSTFFCHSLLALPNKAEPTTNFNIIGYIQDFTVDNLSDPLSAAKITVNGISIVIPKNLKIVMPGTYLTANDIFRGPHGTKDDTKTPVKKRSCIALNDRNNIDAICPKDQPEFPYTAEIVGNIVDNTYIAGLVNIGQIPLQTSGGFIKKICYEKSAECMMKGELLVGPQKDNPLISGRVRLNDPEVNAQGGRFGAASLVEQDDRFKADQGNPTVHAATGYPVCIPRVDPASGNDALCPKSNRFGNAKRFTIGKKIASNRNGLPVSDAPICNTCEPHAMVPLAVGDYIIYSGTLEKDTKGTYISAYSLEADLGIYTSPKTDPAYVFIEVSILGAGGTAFPGIDQETGPGKVTPGQTLVTRFKIVGFTTDPSRNVDVFALDVKDAKSLDKAPRLLQSIPPEIKPPLGRFEVTVDQQVFMPPPREIRAQIKDTAGKSDQDPASNGLEWGKYDAPVAEYIFPEGRVFGGKTPQPGLIPANFEDLCFLSVGFGPLDTLDRCPEANADCPSIDANLPIVMPLAPWPASEQLPIQTTPSKSTHQPPGIFCPQAKP